MEFDTVKVLGLLGAVFMIAAIVFPILWIVGAVLVLISLYYLAKIYGEDNIFNYAFYGVILSLLPAFLFPFMFIGFFSFMPMHMPGDWRFPFWSFAGFWFLVMLLFFFLLVFAGFFFYKSMGLLALKSNIDLFRISGLLVFVGAATLILFVGFLLLIASWIVLAIAFYELKHPPISPEAASVQP